MPRTGRPREFDEDQVVGAAKDLFWARGYEATSVQDLVDALGVKRGSLYGAFGDKRAMLLRALDRYAADVAALLRSLDGDGPVLPALRAVLVAGLLDPAAAARGCMFGNTAVELAPADPGATDLVRAGFAATEEAFRRALERARASGELPDRGDPAAQAALLLALAQGLQVVARTERDAGRLTAAVDAALDALR